MAVRMVVVGGFCRLGMEMDVGACQLGHDFGSCEFVIKCVSASALQCVGCGVCESMDLWVGGLMACLGNGGEHGSRLSPMYL